MNTLAIDTSELRGGIAVRVDGNCVAHKAHLEADYSSWLLPAVENLLLGAVKTFSEIDLLAVATGPGSFTGVRVGLCAVKAWAEVYGKSVIGVSRLEALARIATVDGLIAASYNAHRGQVFAGLYRREAEQLRPVGTELVTAPADFLTYVAKHSCGTGVQWASLDPELFTELPEWKPEWKIVERDNRTSTHFTAELANSIGEISEERAARGEFTDVLALDANYVRRSDAEIYWKGPARRVG